MSNKFYTWNINKFKERQKNIKKQRIMTKDVQKYFQEWEKINNPFYPNEMRWDRAKVNNFLKSYKEQLLIHSVSISDLIIKAEQIQKENDFMIKKSQEHDDYIYYHSIGVGIDRIIKLIKRHK